MKLIIYMAFILVIFTNSYVQADQYSDIEDARCKDFRRKVEPVSYELDQFKKKHPPIGVRVDVLGIEVRDALYDKWKKIPESERRKIKNFCNGPEKEMVLQKRKYFAARTQEFVLQKVKQNLGSCGTNLGWEEDIDFLYLNLCEKIPLSERTTRTLKLSDSDKVDLIADLNNWAASGCKNDQYFRSAHRIITTMLLPYTNDTDESRALRVLKAKADQANADKNEKTCQSLKQATKDFSTVSPVGSADASNVENKSQSLENAR